jgi:UDP-N-acetylmuramoyl-tripeptide--D-alanyl-D-alanine ligase
MAATMIDTATAARSMSGRVVGASVACTGVSTDSRTVRPGDLFFALAGERFDGHDFVPAALARGAAAAVVAHSRASALGGPLVVVDDPLAALGRLAAAWRAQFELPLAVVVGSNGKTTVKEMTAAILRDHFGADAVLATTGNLNNAIGLPLTLLGLRDAHRAAVVEMGMNHRGETRELAAIARPTIAVVNNAQREHQEFMRTVSEVAAEHADAIRALPRGGVAIVNADDAHALRWREAATEVGASVVLFGLVQRADVSGRCAGDATGSDLSITTAEGEADVRLAIPGRHMAMNALAATACAMAAGATLASVARGLAGFRPVAGRLEVLRAPGGATVIDDTYNANPDSVRAAIDVLARAPSPRWRVRGDMGEVGVPGPAFHREIGTCAREAGIERLFAIGTLAEESVAAFGEGASHHADVDALVQAIASQMRADATLLVKGSRFMAMERVVAALAGGARGGA